MEAKLSLSVTVLMLVTSHVSGAEIEDVRIQGEMNSTFAIGYVQVYRENQWQSVCGHGWDKHDARVVCKQLGYDRGVDFHVRETGLGNPDDPVWKVEITCTEKDTSLDLCRARVFRGKCTAAPISCDTRNSSLPDGEIRLFDGTTPYSGRVEVSHDGLWGSICDRSWDDTSAGAVCAMLGFYEGGTSVKYSNFGPGFEWFYDDVKCSGTAERMQDCFRRGYQDGSCYVTRTAGVVCLQEYTSNLTGQLRLSGSDSLNKGFLEVNYYGVWGTVCNTDWDAKDARVACKQMGYSTGQLTSDDFKARSGPIWLDMVECTGNETSILDCQYNGWYDQWCLHEKDVKIECLASDTVLDVLDGTQLPVTMVVYIVIASAVPLIMLVAVVVAVVVRNRRRRSLVHRELEVTSTEKNKAYNLDTTFFMQSGHNKDILGDQYTYIAGDPNRCTTSGVYEYILDDGPVYLDLLDDGYPKAQTDNSPASFQRANTPLPDLPIEGDIKNESYLTTVGMSDSDGYLLPVSQRKQTQQLQEPMRQNDDNGYLQPISVRAQLNHKPESEHGNTDDSAYLRPISVDKSKGNPKMEPVSVHQNTDSYIQLKRSRCEDDTKNSKSELKLINGGHHILNPVSDQHVKHTYVNS